LVLHHHRVVDVTHAFRPQQSSRSIAGRSARADRRRVSSYHNRWHPHRHPESPSPSRSSGTDDRVTIVSLRASGGDSSLAGGTTGVQTPPAPPIAMPPRRRFADFGIASEQAEPIHDDAGGGTHGQQDTGSGDGEDSTTPSRLTGFSIEGRSSRFSRGDVADGDVDNEASGGAPGTASPGGDNAEPPTTTASTVSGAGDGQNAKTVVDNGHAVQEVVEASSTTVTSVEEKPSVDAFAAKEQPSSASEPSSSALLIQTQQSPSSPINLLRTELDVEAFGLIPIFVIGISLFLALGVYFNQANDDTDKGIGTRDARENEEPGFVETTKNLLQRVKDAGTAGAISYALWEAAFWGVSVPVCLTSYRQVTGHWPDLTSSEDVRKVGLEAFAFVNFARLAVPIRVGLALSTIPWVEQNILGRINNGIQGGEVDRIAGAESDEEATIAASIIVNEQSPQGYDPDDVQQTQRTIRTTGGVSVVVPWQPVDTKSSLGDNEYLTSDSLAVSQVEDRLRQMETEASLISSLALQKVNAGIDPTLLQKKQAATTRNDGSFGEYCEPGQVNEDCADYIRGYLDSLASTGAVATDGEVRAIVGYLDSLSSNVAPNKSTGAAFTNYLDALSSGYIPAPSSAKAVASYLDALSDVTAPSTSATGGVESGAVGSRINEVEERLNRLESSITRLPDDIASKLVEWQISQERKLAEDTERIIKLLVEGKRLEK